MIDKDTASQSTSDRMGAAIQWADDSTPAPESVPDNPTDRGALETLSILALQASKTVPMSMPQPMRGTAVHMVFEGFVKVLNRIDPRFDSEVTYLDRVPWPIYAAFGSSRADAIYGNRSRPQFIVDVKTGRARLNRGQARKYQQNLPLGTRLYQILVPPQNLQVVSFVGADCDRLFG